MAEAERNSGPRTAQGTITQAELLDAKFLEWQASHAEEFCLDAMHEQSRSLQAAKCLQRKLAEGAALAPGLLTIKRRRPPRTLGRKTPRRASLAISITDAPGKWRADVEPAGPPEESSNVAEQFDPKLDAAGHRLALSLARLSARYGTPEEVAELAERFHMTPEQLLGENEIEE